MTSLEREVLVNRILAGYLRLNKLQIYPPSFLLLYESNLIYKRVYDKCKSQNLLDEVSILNFLYDRGIWTDEKEDRFSKIPKLIEDSKLELYKSRNNTAKINKIKRELEGLKDEYSELFSDRHSYDEFTTEGIANFAKKTYLIRNTTFSNGKLYSFSKETLGRVLTKFQENLISETQYRELGRTDPWSGHWSAIKNGLNLVPQPTEEQLRLIRYSIFYDNLYQASDCPPTWVINDDDMLDGYLIEKNISRKKEEESMDIDKVLGSKIANSSEVYIVCDDEDENALFSSKDFNKINDLNDAYGRSVRTAREKALDEHGTLKDHELPDVKRRLKMQINSMG